MSVSSRQAFDDVIQRLKEPQYIAQYLTSCGYDIGKKFHCPNPDHPDKNPSSQLIRSGNRGYCFSCQTSFDIFDLAVWLEGCPSSGPGWVSETVKYLADKYCIPFEMPDLSPAELHEMEIISAYSHAAQIIRHYVDANLSETFREAVARLKWPQQLRYKLGVGGVPSYQEYIHKMTVQYRHSIQFMRDCDLADGKTSGGEEFWSAGKIFSPDSLIYSIRDISGTVVGFSARNLKFAEQEEAHKAGTLKYQPKKYVHTRGTDKGTLFDKERTLYNLDLAKKHDGPITVVEGNADCVTLYGGGNLGTVGLLGSAFTREHLNTLCALGKKHIIVALDADKGGQKGTKKIVEMVEDVGGTVGLRLEVVLAPPGIKDPDEFVRTYSDLETGVNAWRQLERLDLFGWSVKERMEKGEDPFTICESTIPLIVNNSSNVVRNQMARELSRLTHTNEDLIVRDVLRLLDQEDMLLAEERSVITDTLSKKLRQDPQRAEAYVSAAISQYETVSKRKVGFNVESILQHLDLLFDAKEKNTSKFELRTGFKRFDDMFGGIPKYGQLFSLPGKPHHGKSIFLDNLVVGLLDNNPDLQILLHTVDDSTNDRINRLLGARTSMPSDVFRRPGFYLNDPEGQQAAPENFHERYYEAKAWYRRLHEEARLIVVDPEILPGTMECLKSLVADLRKKYADQPLIVIGDNFHLYSMNTNETGEQYIRAMSKFVKEEIISLRTTCMFTMEIPTESMKPGTKPSYLNLKGSRGLSFDAKANVSVYNDLQDWKANPENACLWWAHSDFMETRVNEDGVIQRVKIRKPILEIIVDKNKVSGDSGSIFYRLENKSGRMVECSDVEQQECFDKQIAKSAEMQSRAAKDRGQTSRAPYRSQLSRVA